MIETETLKVMLAEMQARLDHPLEYMRPFTLDLDYPLARAGQSKRRGDDRFYKLSADVTPEGFELLMNTLPPGVRLTGIFWVDEAVLGHSGQPAAPNGQGAASGEASAKTRKRKAEREHGDYGGYWAIVKGQRQIQNWPDVLEWLKVSTPAEAEVRLREVFGVEHMDFVSPAEAERVFTEAGLANAVTMLRQAEAQWKEKQERTQHND